MSMPNAHADLIFRGGVVRTLDPANPRVEAVAIRGRRILLAGPLRDMEGLRGPSTQVRDLGGAALFPGFIDAHAHVGGLGKTLRQVRLDGAKSVDEAVARVRAGAKPGATGWIEGRGWDQNDWPGAAYPTWGDLESVGDRPIALRRVDGHALWVNRVALELADITRATADPDGGKILRDTNGEVTGVLIDLAMNLVIDRIPPPPREELVERLRVAMRTMVAAGLTGAMDAGVDARGIEAFRALGADGGFLAHVDLFLSDDDDLLWDPLESTCRHASLSIL